MSMNDPIANALNIINNAEFSAKRECNFNYSNFLEKIIDLLKKERYVKNYKVEEKDAFKKITVYLNGSINKCKAIKPRYAVKRDNYEVFEKSYLISRDVGILIVSTNQGVMSHKEAKEKNLGGRLIGYIY